MQESGRWGIESHSNDGHGVVPLDAAGDTGAFFVNRQWLASEQRLETIDEFRARITADLDAVTAAFAAHDLPEPTYFAHPRSATAKDANDPATLDVLRDVLGARYAASFINRDFASQLRAGDVQAGTLPRLELVGADTATGAFDKLERAVAVPVTDSRPFTRPSLWVGDDGKPVAGVTPDRVALDPGAGTWVNAHYAPGAAVGLVALRRDRRRRRPGRRRFRRECRHDRARRIARRAARERLHGIRARAARRPRRRTRSSGRRGSRPRGTHVVGVAVDSGHVTVAVDRQSVYAGAAADPDRRPVGSRSRCGAVPRRHPSRPSSTCTSCPRESRCDPPPSHPRPARRAHRRRARRRLRHELGSGSQGEPGSRVGQHPRLRRLRRSRPPPDERVRVLEPVGARTPCRRRRGR